MFAFLQASVEYQLPYAEYVSANDTNDNRILDTLHRIVVNERKRPILHRTATLQPVSELRKSIETHLVLCRRSLMC
jgi:hypothetical protein